MLDCFEEGRGVAEGLDAARPRLEKRKRNSDAGRTGAVQQSVFFSGGATFRDHNFSRFLDGVDQHRERSIVLEIQRHYKDPRGGLPPHVDAIYRSTLSPKTCGSFLRAHSALPVDERDYYLSKLFQFLYLPLKARYRLDDNERVVKDALEGLLDGLPDDLLRSLSAFDWEGFYRDTRSHPLEATLGRILRHLPKVRSGVRKVAAAGSSGLVAPFRTPAGATWGEVWIRFIGDFRVQITLHHIEEVRNFVEMGFEDRRGKGKSKPDSSWELLRKLAETKGLLQCSQEVDGVPWRKIETRVQTIRRRLHVLFGIPGDPIEYERRSNCYRTRLKIEFPNSDRL